jgi:hypothetical protein
MMARREAATGKKPDVSTKLAKLANLAKRVEPSPPPPALRLTFSIPEFCLAARISEDFYYKLKRAGQGPREAKIGKRTLITVTAANDWLIAHELASNTTTA